jgi:hypothetical protein
VIHGRPSDTAARATPSKTYFNNNISILTTTKMPPQRSDKKAKLIQQEGRLLLAIKAIKDGRYLSAAAATRSFEIPVSTLKARINGRESAAEKRASGHIFT